MVLAVAAAQAAALSPRQARRALDHARRIATKRPNEAVAEIRALIETNPELLDAHLLLLRVSGEGAREVLRREYELKAEAEPRNALLRFVLGRLADSPASRLACYKKAVELDPNFFEAQLAVGRLCRLPAVDDLAGSRRALEAAVALKPHSASAHAELGLTLAAAGLKPQAAASFRRALDLDEGCESAWLGLSRVVEPERAEKILEQGARECGRSAPLWWELARLRWTKGRFRDAIRPLERALRYEPSAPFATRAREMLACAYLMQGWHRSARRIGATRWSPAAEEMARGKLSKEAFGKLYLAETTPTRRLALLADADRLAPRSMLVKRAYGAALLRAERWVEAALVLTQALALAPDDQALRQRCAAAHLATGDVRAALAAIGAERNRPNRQEACLLAEAEAVKAGQLEVAAVRARHLALAAGEADREARLREVLERYPKALAARVDLAGLLAAAGRQAEAQAIAEEGLRLGGHPLLLSELHAILGQVALDERSLASAIEHYRKATELAPAVARHHGGLARAYLARGEFGPAGKALVRQLSLDPNSYDLPTSRPASNEAACSLVPRLATGDVLHYRYSTDGGQPGREMASVAFDYVVEAVHGGQLVEATVEITGTSGRPVEGGNEFVGTRIPLSCSSYFGLVDLERPRRLPGEFDQLPWLAQFVQGPALPVPKRPGEAWREPAWTTFSRLYGGEVHFQGVRRGKALLTKTIAYRKPAPEPTADYEVMAVKAEGTLVFDLERRLVERVELVARLTLFTEEGSRAELPPWRHRLELLGVERGARPQSGRVLIEGVPYVRQVGPRCAAASLAMMLRHFGHRTDQQKLFEELAGREGGVPAHRLPVVARALGFEPHVYLSGLADLKEKVSAGLPLMLYLSPMGMGHAVVAVGYDERRREVIVHDPANSPLRRIPYSKLEALWRENDHTAMVVIPRGRQRSMNFPGEEAVAATLEANRQAAAGCLEEAESALRRALSLHPNYLEATVALARVLVAKDQRQQAHQVLDQTIRRRPECQTPRVVKADLLLLEGKGAEAVSLLRAVYHADPQNLRCLNALATAYVMANERKKAIEALETAVRAAPEWSVVRFRLASLYLLDGRYDSAIAQYQAVLSGEPRNATALYLLAVAVQQSLLADRRGLLPWKSRREMALRAIEAIQTLRELEGPSCETSALLAYIYDELGNSRKQIALLRRSTTELTNRQLRPRHDVPSDADPFSFAARVSSALKKLAAKLETFAYAARERSTNLNNLAWAFAIRGENLAEARRLAQESVRLRTAAFNLDTLAWVDLQLGNLEAARDNFLKALELERDPAIHIHLAITWLKLGQKDRARSEMARAYELGERDADVHLAAANAYAQVGMADRELAELEAAIKADPQHRRALYRLASVLAERREQLPRALRIAADLYQSDPEDPRYAGLYGAACQLTGKSRKARSLLARALPQDPLLGDEPTARFRYYFAINLVASGEEDAARKQLKLYLATNPRGRLADKARALLARLTGPRETEGGEADAQGCSTPQQH